MDIVIGMPWRVKVEHMADALYIKPACRDIGCHEQFNVAIFKRFQLLLARRLVDVTMDFAGTKAVALKAGV